MLCIYCKNDNRPTYNSKRLGETSICVPCIQKRHKGFKVGDWVILPPDTTVNSPDKWCLW